MPLSGPFPSGTPGRPTRSVAAIATPGTPRVPRTEPPEMPEWAPRPPGTWPEAGTGSRAARRDDPFVAMTPNRPPDTTGTHP